MNKYCKICEDYRGNPPPHVCQKLVTKDWEKEFDEKFVEKSEDGTLWTLKNDSVGQIRYFIKCALSQQQEQIAKYLEGKKYNSCVKDSGGGFAVCSECGFQEDCTCDVHDNILTESAQEIREGKFNQ